MIYAVIILLLLLVLLIRFQGTLVMVMGLRAYAAGEKEKGLSLFRKALAKRLSPSSQLSCGFYLLRESHLEEAEAVIAPLKNHRTKKFNPGRAVVYYSLILWKKGLLDEAIESLYELLEDDFRTSTLYMNLGFYLLEKGVYEKALELNQEAIEYDKNSAVIKDNLAYNYIKLERWEEAIEIYDALIPENPSFPDVYVNRARIHLHNQEKSEAKELLEQALNKNFSFLGTVTKEEIEKLLSNLD